MFGRRNVRDDEDVVEEVEERPGHVWSPAQGIAVILGAIAIVFGAITLFETGLDFGDITSPHESVLGFHATPLLGLCEIVWGVLMVLAGLRPVAGKPFMALLGAAAVALGALIVLDAWPQRLHDSLGVHDRNGWLFIAAGGIALVAALLVPVMTSPGRRTVTQRHVVHS